jgi:hypothetical protein
MALVWRILETLDYSLLRLTGRLPRKRSRTGSPDPAGAATTARPEPPGAGASLPDAPAPEAGSGEAPPLSGD